MREITLPRRAVYTGLRLLCRISAVVLFRFRCEGRRRLPKSGAVLVCANHQSFLDPVIVGITLDRRLNFLARETLFRFAPFRWLIQFLDAIPIDLSGSGTSGLRESLRRIRGGEMMLIFPEGTRTIDGEVAPLKPGFCVLARRGGVSVLPVGIDGAFDVWPRNARLPSLSPIHVCVGNPIGPLEIAEVTDDRLIEEVHRRIHNCLLAARALRAGEGPKTEWNAGNSAALLVGNCKPRD